jgi:hypothetical protein
MIAGQSRSAGDAAAAGCKLAHRGTNRGCEYSGDNMVAIMVEFLEARTLFANSATSAAIAEDLVVIHADRQQIHLDGLQLQDVARIDRQDSVALTIADRLRIRHDFQRLHFDEQGNSPQILIDLPQLESDESALSKDIRNSAVTARSDRNTVLLKIAADEMTLGTDLNQLKVDRGSKD